MVEEARAAAAGDCNGGVREEAASEVDVTACVVADSGSCFDWSRGLRPMVEGVEFVR